MTNDNPNITTFPIDVTGDTTGERFVGVFQVKNRLSFREQLRRDEIRRSLLGVTPPGTEAFDRATSAAQMFSELHVRIVEAPSWWKNADNGLDLSDDKVLMTVHTAAIKAENDRIAAVVKAGADAKTQLEKAAPTE